MSLSSITIFGAIALVILNLTAFTINERELAIKLQVGDVVKADYEPGLHFKVPLIDTVHKVRVDFQYKQEFGFRTTKPGVRTSYTRKGLENESWMLTGDLKIAEVHWVVQYKIKDPFFYLFKAFHGLHLLGGLYFWGKTTSKFLKGNYKLPNIQHNSELCAIYWHFLLFVWLVLFGLMLFT